MAALSITTVVPVDNMQEGVLEWATVLGVEPTFVDGDRWAQFDVGTTRLALSGTDRTSDSVGVLVKVDDIAAHADTVRGSGLDVDDPTQGSHEQRSVVHHPNGATTILYSS